MTTPRLPDWQTRYGLLVGSRLRAPFVWGDNDCASFAADCVQACTGLDPLHPERGAYGTAQQAVARIESYGGMVALGDALFGARKAPQLARVGDVGMGTLDGRETLLVCNGTHWIGPALDGLAQVRAEDITHAWEF